MAFTNQDRKTSIQSDRLNLKQTPADIWEYSDSDKDSTPQVWLKEPWELLYYKPPIGIPTFWFTSVLPDWALYCTDGGGYDFATYPELDNEYFKQFLADFTDFGSTDDDTDFTMPVLMGISPIIAGTNDLIAIKNVAGADTANFYTGGEVGELIRDAIREITGYAYNLAGASPYGGGAFSVWGGYGGWAHSATAYGAFFNFAASRVVPTANNNRVASFGCSLIVRFE